MVKSDVESTLVTAVAAASRHQTHLPPSAAAWAVEDGADQPLSPRESEVARLVALGRSNKEVAAALGITPKTAETYRTRVMRTLGAHSVVDLVHDVISLGLIEFEAS